MHCHVKCIAILNKKTIAVIVLNVFVIKKNVCYIKITMLL